MAYIDYQFYLSIHDTDPMSEAAFTHWRIYAEQILKSYTTGIDDYQKLQMAFPTDENDALMVRMCDVELIDALHMIDEAKKTAAKAAGYTQTENGLQGNVVSSKSAGNESISFSAAGSDSQISRAALNENERLRLINGIVRAHLDGVKDANGVHLLYMGSYPVRG